jgi:hypothetical protein
MTGDHHARHAAEPADAAMNYLLLMNYFRPRLRHHRHYVDEYTKCDLSLTNALPMMKTEVPS